MCAFRLEILGMPLALVMLVTLLAAAPAGAATQTVRLTMYDDGLSCPGDCDAHVVFHPSLNGTVFAHAPGAASGALSKCVAGAECRICFADDGKQCMNVMYRGGGPSPMTFDFTPAFYEAQCPKAAALPVLAKQCASLQKAAAALDGRVNCIRNQDEAICKALIAEARSRQQSDRPLYEECKSVGEKKFNSTRPVAERRSNGCAYELKGTGGPNSHGTTWRKLLPGTCRPGTFVGRDGLDCCNGNQLADGPLGIECRAFYPKPKP